MTTGTSPRSVLLFGASQRILDECVAALRDLGYTAQGTTDFSGDIASRFDVARLDLVSLGGLVPADRKAEIREQIAAINPRAIVLDALAGIPGLIASEVQAAFTAGAAPAPGYRPGYSTGDRSIRLTLAGPAAVKVTVWWRTALIPPDPKSDSLVIFDGRLPGGDHAIPVPRGIPTETETPTGPRQAPWFVTVQAGQAIHNLTVAAGQLSAQPRRVSGGGTGAGADGPHRPQPGGAGSARPGSAFQYSRSSAHSPPVTNRRIRQPGSVSESPSRGGPPSESRITAHHSTATRFPVTIGWPNRRSSSRWVAVARVQ